MGREKIFVTKSFLPEFSEYEEYLREIFSRHVLTNQGPLVRDLEARLESYLGVKRLQYLANGTLALQLAIRALGLEGSEVITTPFSYVATTSSLLWENCHPVFVDIEPERFTIDPELVEKAITPSTRAIMPVHVFGHCCNVERLADIAARHKLRIIYDGAHAFGTRYNGSSVLNYGDISTLSFHATKVYHTVEGGACICSDESINHKLDLLKRFGHLGDTHYQLGINAKQSEINAAMGLANLKHIDEIIAERRELCELYDALLGDSVSRPKSDPNCTWNSAYYPILFQSNKQLKKVFSALAKNDIYPRRYFYPALNTLSYLNERASCPIAEDISERIACLPLYVGLSHEYVEEIVSLIQENL